MVKSSTLDIKNVSFGVKIFIITLENGRSLKKTVIETFVYLGPKVKSTTIEHRSVAASMVHTVLVRIDTLLRD